MKFNPCTDNCTYEGTHCEGCGRPHKDIAEMKSLVMALVNFAQEKGYENHQDFADSVSKSIVKKLSK